MILYYGVEHGYHVEFYAYSQTIFWNENMYKIQKHKSKNFLFIDNDINVDITKTNLYYAHSVLMDFFYCVSQHSTPTYYTINSFYECIFIKKKIFSISLYYDIAFTSQEKQQQKKKNIKNY